MTSRAGPPELLRWLQITAPVPAPVVRRKAFVRRETEAPCARSGGIRSGSRWGGARRTRGGRSHIWTSPDRDRGGRNRRFRPRSGGSARARRAMAYSRHRGGGPRGPGSPRTGPKAFSRRWLRRALPPFASHPPAMNSPLRSNLWETVSFPPAAQVAAQDTGRYPCGRSDSSAWLWSV
jgi:hypothetical protein